METKLSAKKIESVRLKYGFENRIDVGAVGSKDGLSLRWKENSLISLKSFSSFHIDVDVHDVECDTTWRLMGFHGNLEEKNRRESWDLLRRLGQDQRIPWVVLGDFNEIVSSFEKKGGRLRADRQMFEFYMALEDCGLNDLGYIGREKHVFRCFSIWCLDNSLEEKIRRSWGETAGSIPDKIKGLGQHLHKWSRIRFRESKRSRLELEEKLNCLYDREPTNEVLAEITDVQVGLNLQANREKIFWEQRARVNRLKNGDRNTSFFHKMAVQRQNRSRIHELEGTNGTRVHTTKKMLKLASDFFKDLFSASEMGADERVFRMVEKQITDDMNEILL
ncbi:hypothetical protein CXB51_024631 [Gossypium anomalum]|uniref:Endonuclease/exonuclease/phosphatase domain-containing protein n=1 Tax=Gossypium anomalum TaxID=47600 RepID=A0A8J5YB92_9ROSI|nr:hypothetical protein CXB51_024631 [Gossypium anomalum]